MFDFDPGKLVVFGIVALAVIPPKDLPRVLRTVGQYVGKMRRMASEFQGQFMEAMREAEKSADLDGVKKELSALEDVAKIDTTYDPTHHLRADLNGAADGAKSIGQSAVSLETPAMTMQERFAADGLAKPLESPPPVAEPAAPGHAP